MAEIKIAQGTDRSIKLQFLDSSLTAIPLTTYDDYHVYIYKNETGKIKVLDYRKNPTGSQIQIYDNDVANGIIEIIIPRSWTATTSSDSFWCEIKTSASADSKYASSLNVRSYETLKNASDKEVFELFELIKSADASDDFS